jgi:hypothetical protein
VEKILDGNLARFEMPDVLTFLNMGRRTGVLVLEHPEQESKVFLRDGRPIYATSSKEDLRIGNMLVRQGRVKTAELERALDLREPGQKIGEALLQNRILNQDELASFLKIQVSEVIFDTFTWKKGLFSFYDRVPPPETVVTLAMDLQNLIMEGVRRIDERGRLSEVFPDLNMVAEAVANPERVKSSVTLTQEEWQVLFLVDGRRSLSEICRLAGNPDDLTTLQIVYRLVSANLVVVVEPLQVRSELAEAEPDLGLPPPGELTHRAGPRATVGIKPASAPEPPPAPVAVQYSAPITDRRIPDDTKEIVSSKAVAYLGLNKIMVGRLVLVEQGKAETSFPLSKDSSTLGRHRNNDIVIADPKVSSFHARIDRTADGHVILDLKSRNGTFVNGRRVETIPLKTDDEIRVGTARLRYKVDYTAQA